MKTEYRIAAVCMGTKEEMEECESNKEAFAKQLEPPELSRVLALLAIMTQYVEALCEDHPKMLAVTRLATAESIKTIEFFAVAHNKAEAFDQEHADHPEATAAIATPTLQ